MEQQTAMQKANPNGGLVQACVEITREDAIAVATAKFERQHNTILKEVDTRLETARKDEKVATTALDKALEAQEKRILANLKTDYAGILQAWGFEGVKFTANFTNWDKDTGDRSTWNVTLHAHMGAHIGSSLSANKESLIVDGAATLRVQLDSASELVEKLRELGMKHRRELADLPRLERQARGTLAESALRNSGEAGNQLLDALEGESSFDVATPIFPV